MKHYCNKYNIKILAYCLMTNHFHLFIKQTSDWPASKSKLIEDEAYFIWVIKYILENPVEAKMVKNISDWEFSNARDLLSLRNGTLTDTKYVESFFQSRKIMIEFLTDQSIKVDYSF